MLQAELVPRIHPFTANAALTAVLSQKEYGDKTLCLQNMAKYDSNANESFLLMFESTPLTARGRISGDLWEDWHIAPTT